MSLEHYVLKMSATVARNIEFFASHSFFCKFPCDYNKDEKVNPKFTYLSEIVLLSCRH